MSDDIEKLFKELGFETIVLDVGDHVYCDACNKDYIEDEAKGGFLFGSKAICPDCAPSWEHSAKTYNETKYIVARPTDDESFRDFVYRIRGDDK